MATKHIHMGTITRPHGIKGELCVDWYADSPDALRATFYLQAPNAAQGDFSESSLRAVTNAKVRMHKGRPLLTLAHIQDRNAAETLRGVRIYVHRDDLPQISEDEAYIHDLLGLTIIDSATNNELGILEGVEFPTENQMLWRIMAPTGQEILLPAVEEFIDEFEEEEGKVYVSPPEGLVELYLTEDAPSKPKKTPRAQQTHRQQRPQKKAATSESNNGGS